MGRKTFYFDRSIFDHNFGPRKENEYIEVDIEKLRGTGHNIWDKVFKNGPSKICGRQPLKNRALFIWYIFKTTSNRKGGLEQERLSSSNLFFQLLLVINVL